MLPTPLVSDAPPSHGLWRPAWFAALPRRLTGERAAAYLVLLSGFLVSRLLLAAVGWAALGTGGWPAAGDLIGLTLRWDAHWYLRLAAEGYSATEGAEHTGQTLYGFMPLYPLLIRAAVAVLGLSPAVTAVLLSNLFFLAALVLVFEYARALGVGARPATAAGLLICVAPQSFVFSAPYSESLFLLLSAGAMLALRRRTPWISGLLAAALSATRVNGVFFAVFAACHLLRRDGRNTLRVWRDPARYAPIVLAPLGVFGFWWFCFLSTGDAFAQSSTLRAGWEWSAAWPWNNLGHRLLHGLPHERFWVGWSLLAFAASLLLIRQRRYEEFALCACSFALSWSGTVVDSLVRHSVVMFPVFVALAQATNRWPSLLALLGVGMAALNGWLMSAWALSAVFSL